MKYYFVLRLHSREFFNEKELFFKNYLGIICKNNAQSTLRKTNKIRISETENKASSLFKKSCATKIETMGKAEVSEKGLRVQRSLYQTLNLDRSIFSTDAKNRVISISVILDGNKYENVYYKFLISYLFLKRS